MKKGDGEVELDSLDVIWQQYELDQIAQGMQELFPERGFSLEDLIATVMSGNIWGAMKLLLFGNITNFGAQLVNMKNVFLWILVIGILATLMTDFVEVFDRNQVADLSFYLFYLLLTEVLLKNFYFIEKVAITAMENMVLFHKLLIPTYLLAVGAATGITTVNAYSQLLILIIYGVEQILIKSIVPMIYGYFLLAVLGGIWMEEKLTLLMEVLEKIIGWMLKGAIGIVTGVSIFQSIITPVVDSVKTTALQKVITMVPGAGNVADGVLELLAGSAIMIKNSVGIVLLLLLIALCAEPMIQIFMTAALLKISAALMGLVADKKLTACVSQAGNAGMLMLRTTGCALLLFLISLAVAAASLGNITIG